MGKKKGKARLHSEAENPEFATNDADLTSRLQRIFNNIGSVVQFKPPNWLAKVQGCDGEPGQIDAHRWDILRSKNYVPFDDDERRFNRNQNVVKQVLVDLERAEKETGVDSRQEREAILKFTLSGVSKKARLTANDSQTLFSAAVKANASSRAQQVNPKTKAISTQGALPTTSGLHNGAALVKKTQLDPQACSFIPARDREEAQRLKTTILAPFYQRMHQDSATIMQLTKENAELTDALWLKEFQLHLVASGAADGQETGLFSTKRKAEDDVASSKQRKTEEDVVTQTTSGDDDNIHILDLAHKISAALEETVANDTIQDCGAAPLRIIADKSDEVLGLAYDKLNTWQFDRVRTCWRRLYEEASLYKAAQLLRVQAGFVKVSDNGGSKRRKLDDVTPGKDWIAEIVMVLDKGLTLSGAPGRADVFQMALKHLDILIDGSLEPHLPHAFDTACPTPFRTDHPIGRVDETLDFEAFQNHIDMARSPVVIPGLLSDWPASQQWQLPAYFMQLTLGGRRIVPIEIGKSYTEEGWTQRVMTFGQFMHSYLLPPESKEVGYLAQHDLFAQIPALRNDIMVPDYCFTAPPPPDAVVLRTAGLATVERLDEPMLNAWFGPKGTKTPLHTDPYHNILCQVVGYKYIRLYPPSETAKLYPLGKDDKGVNMGNTSQVDVSLVRTLKQGEDLNADEVRDVMNVNQKFPMLKGARYQEAILGPGECLYVPLGWWHYVESLSTSFSISFWWN